MKEEIFDVMENVIGWDLDDFNAVAEIDLNNLERHWSKIQDCLDNHKSINYTDDEFEDLNMSLGFAIDFMRAVAIIENTKVLEDEK